LFIPLSNDRIVQRRLDLKDEVKRLDENHLLVTSFPQPEGQAGAVWTYQIRHLARHEPVRYEIKHAPEGMTLSSNGLLTWRILGNIKGKGRVEIEVTDSKGNVLPHRFTISFR
jgi:hypothetical protein